VRLFNGLLRLLLTLVRVLMLHQARMRTREEMKGVLSSSLPFGHSHATQLAQIAQTSRTICQIPLSQGPALRYACPIPSSFFPVPRLPANEVRSHPSARLRSLLTLFARPTDQLLPSNMLDRLPPHLLDRILELATPAAPSAPRHLLPGENKRR
jgi:hypothetical protein